MKYSLKNRQFKQTRKRNHIFPPNPSQPPHQDTPNPLTRVIQSKQELEQSRNIQQEKSNNHINVYDFIDFQHTSRSKSKSQVNTQSNYHNAVAYVKPSRHNLSPNNKPISSLVVNALKKDNYKTQQCFQDRKLRKDLTINSNTVNFSYYNHESQVQMESLTQMAQQTYSILMKNNKRIEMMQKVIQEYNSIQQKLSYLLSNQLKKSIKFQQKIDLFLNTMRNVYEGLRISRLKQDNLQLYLKLHDKEQIFQSNQHLHKKQITKPQNLRISHVNFEQSKRHFRQSEQLVSLVQYESDTSFESSYPNNNFKNRQHNSKVSYQQFYNKNEVKQNIQNEKTKIYEKRILPSENSHYNSNNFDATFHKFDDLNQSLSPFQTNQLISPSASIKDNFFFKKQKDQTNSNDNKSKILPSQSQFQKIKQWLIKSHNEGIKCWLDQMNCLRRINMTYIFNSNGQVVTMSKNTYKQLVQMGYLTRLSTGE